MFNWGVFLFVSCGLPCAMPHEMEKWFPIWCMSLLFIQDAFCFRLAIAGKHGDQSQPLIDFLKSSMEYAHAFPNESDNCPPVFLRDLFAVSAAKSSSNSAGSGRWMIPFAIFRKWFMCLGFRNAAISEGRFIKWNLQSIRMGLRTYSWSTWFGGCYDCHLMVWFADREFILVPPFDSISFKGRSWIDNR